MSSRIRSLHDLALPDLNLQPRGPDLGREPEAAEARLADYFRDAELAADRPGPGASNSRPNSSTHCAPCSTALPAWCVCACGCS
jgi:hypothetical protein